MLQLWDEHCCRPTQAFNSLEVRRTHPVNHPYNHTSPPCSPNSQRVSAQMPSKHIKIANLSSNFVRPSCVGTSRGKNSLTSSFPGGLSSTECLSGALKFPKDCREQYGGHENGLTTGLTNFGEPAKMTIRSNQASQTKQATGAPALVCAVVPVCDAACEAAQLPCGFNARGKNQDLAETNVHKSEQAANKSSCVGKSGCQD